MQQSEIKKVIEILEKIYPDVDTALNYDSAFELLIATILSAQTTDKQVNKVTQVLFKKYNKPEDFAEMSREELAGLIKSIGLYHNKSKYIIDASKMIIDRFRGEVPVTRNELMELPGVGRKTANVVLACAFEKNSFPVDTHVFRTANRIGLVDTDKVIEVEKELMKKIPEKLWTKMHHRLIFHGRETCKARNPQCNRCKLKDLCDYYSSA